MGQLFSRVGSTFLDNIISILLIMSALIGVGFFIINWNSQLTDGTIFSTILVEIPIQVFIKQQKQNK